MADIKTKQNNARVIDFINKVENDKKREFAYKILDLMKSITKEEPKMWGDSIVGFGSFHYKYKSGREGDMLQTGFSPRKQAMTLYIMPGFKQYEKLLQDLGKFKTGKSCLYIKNEEDVDMKVLKEIITKAVKYIRNKKWD
jgi:nucleoid DNA-binding protein